MTTTTEREEEMVNCRQLAALLNVPKSTIYELAKDGKIPGFRIGKHYRFYFSEVKDSVAWGRLQHS